MTNYDKMTKLEIFLIVIMLVFTTILCTLSMAFGYRMCAEKFRKCGYELKSHYIPSTNCIEVIKIDK